MTHNITYCYPSSPGAVQTGMGREGAYVLSYDIYKIGYATYQDALTAVPAGSEPGRWSMDHPANAHFLVRQS